jgi:hypothetical protein
MEQLFNLTTTGHLSYALLHRSPVKLASSASSNSRRGTSHARLVRLQAPHALEDGASVLRGSGRPPTAAACSVRRERFLPRTPLPATGARRTRASPREARPWRTARATRATLGPTADRAMHAWKIRTKRPREASPAWSGYLSLALCFARLDTQSAPNMGSRPAQANSAATWRSATTYETKRAAGAWSSTSAHPRPLRLNYPRASEWIAIASPGPR